VLFIYLLAGCLGLSAILLRNADNIDALVLLVQALIVVILITLLERRGSYLARNNGLAGPPEQHPYREVENDSGEPDSVRILQHRGVRNN
jgi:hypothetical protein